jgi:alpha-galactosidase
MMFAMNRKSATVAAFLLAPASLFVSYASSLNYTRGTMQPTTSENQEANRTAIAVLLGERTDSEGFPPGAAWEKARAIRYERDWTGENPDPQRATEVRLLWTAETLFIRFRCTYRTVTVFPDARSDGWRYELWDRDVAETFLQPDSTDPFKYLEFEVSPNGYWIDLAVSHGKIEELHSGLGRRVVKDEKAKTWTAELGIPMKSLTGNFDPKRPWRANFFRIEGEKEPRFYSAWSPTRTPKPNFHVPSAFGVLEFREN